MRRSHLALAAAAWIVTLAAAALVGYLAGSQRAVTVVTGSAYVGIGQASAKADGWWYAIPMDGPWRGVDGGWHDGVPPACLTKVGTTVPIRFAYVQIDGLSGVPARQVVWVDCTV